MISQNGQNGNGTAVADMVPEAGPMHREAPTPGGQPIDLATRTGNGPGNNFNRTSL